MARDWTTATEWFVGMPQFLRGDFEAWWPTRVGQLMAKDAGRAIAPVDYGLLVLDFQRRQVLDSQSYGAVDSVFSMDIAAHGSRRDRIREVFLAGFLPKLECVRSTKPSRQHEPPVVFDLAADAPTFDRLVQAVLTPGIKRVDKIAALLGCAMPAGVDPKDTIESTAYAHLPYRSGWAFQHFEDSREGWGLLRDRLVADGFNLTPADHEQWERTTMTRFSPPRYGEFRP